MGAEEYPDRLGERRVQPGKESENQCSMASSSADWFSGVEVLISLKIRSGPLGNLFRPDTYIHGESGAGNNWAKGCKPIKMRLTTNFLTFPLDGGQTIPKAPSSSTRSSTSFEDRSKAATRCRA